MRIDAGADCYLYNAVFTVVFVPYSGRARCPLTAGGQVAEELLRARSHLVAAEERVRSAAALRWRMLEEADGGPDP